MVAVGEVAVDIIEISDDDVIEVAAVDPGVAAVAVVANRRHERGEAIERTSGRAHLLGGHVLVPAKHHYMSEHRSPPDGEHRRA